MSIAGGQITGKKKETATTKSLSLTNTVMVSNLNSPEMKGTLGNMQITIYTKQCVYSTLKSVALYRHWASVQFNTLC